MGDELAHRQALIDTHRQTDRRTDLGNDNTRMPWIKTNKAMSMSSYNSYGEEKIIIVTMIQWFMSFTMKTQTPVACNTTADPS